MYCKLCGEHLYQQISFLTLFKWKYDMHDKCKNTQHNVTDKITFPMDNIEVDYTYLFESGSSRADSDYIFTHYYNQIIQLYLSKKEWSMLVDLDDIQDTNDLQYILPMAKTKLLMVSMYYEVMLS